MSALVLGMGNPILSDDRVGLLVAQAVADRITGVDFIATPVIGVGLLDELSGYDMVFVIDATTGIGRAPGDVTRLDHTEGLSELFSSHGVNFFDLLRLGKELGLVVPEVGAVFGIEIGECVSFGEELSPELSRTITSTVCGIAEEISGIIERLEHSGSTRR